MFLIVLIEVISDQCIIIEAARFLNNFFFKCIYKNFALMSQNQCDSMQCFKCFSAFLKI